jgi:hypothetical protein
VAVLQNVENRRLEAVTGPDEKDFATGSFVGVGEAALSGFQEATIAESLIRSERHDVSSRMVYVMSRFVDVLEVMGLCGFGRC